jgi:hypothetical protein
MYNGLTQIATVFVTTRGWHGVVRIRWTASNRPQSQADWYPLRPGKIVTAATNIGFQLIFSVGCVLSSGKYGQKSLLLSLIDMTRCTV